MLRWSILGPTKKKKKKPSAPELLHLLCPSPALPVWPCARLSAKYYARRITHGGPSKGHLPAVLTYIFPLLNGTQNNLPCFFCGFMAAAILCSSMPPSYPPPWCSPNVILTAIFPAFLLRLHFFQNRARTDVHPPPSTHIRLMPLKTQPKPNT